MSNCYGGCGEPGADFGDVPNVTDCGCCKTVRCCTEQGCFGCEDECNPGTLNGRVRFGYTCNGGLFTKCDPDNPPHQKGVPCTDIDYSIMMVTIPTFVMGSKGCKFGGVYLLKNIIAQNFNPTGCSTICNGGLVYQQACNWLYGGNDIQSSYDPITRCITGTGCDECTQNGPNTGFPCRKGNSQFVINFSLNGTTSIVDSTPRGYAKLDITIGNFILPFDIYGLYGTYFPIGNNAECGVCSASYRIPIGQRFQCKGSNTLVGGMTPRTPNPQFDPYNDQRTKLCNFPTQVTVEAMY